MAEGDEEAGGKKGVDPPARPRRLRARVGGLEVSLDVKRKRGRPSGPTSVEDVEAELRRAEAEEKWIDVGLRRTLGYGAMAILTLQLVVADVAFFIYGYNRGWNIPVSAIHVWLAAAVLQAWIIVRGVAAYLFPAAGRLDD